MDLAQWRKHIDQVVKDEGQWLGVLDGEGLPLYELGGMISHTFPNRRLDSESIEVTISIADNPSAMNDFVGDEFKVTDGQVLSPKNEETRLVTIVREGSRMDAFVPYVRLPGEGKPTQLVITGVGLRDGLSDWPCPSIPENWKQQSFTSWTTDASGQTYAKARDLAPLEFATLAGVQTVKGPAASTIRWLIQDSFDSVNDLCGWSSAPHAVVEFPAGEDTTKELLIRVNDDSILNTVAEPARFSGLDVTVSMWWPGDPAVRVRSGSSFVSKTWDKPMQVVRVTGG